jgi:hypothetical protein
VEIAAVWTAELRGTTFGEEVRTGQRVGGSQFTKWAVSRSGRLGEKGGRRGPHREYLGGRAHRTNIRDASPDPDPSEMVSVGIACSAPSHFQGSRRGTDTAESRRGEQRMWGQAV